MKKVLGNKKLLWLILGLAVLAILAVAVILIVNMNSDNKVPELYWNVDREANTDPNTGESIREPGEDGLYHVRFAYNGEQVELPVADKQLVSNIDAMDAMALTINDDGIVTEVKKADSAASVICERMYIQEITKDTVVLNSSIAMSGKQVVVKNNDLLRVYNMSSKSEFVGKEIPLAELQPMDTVSIYGVLDPKGDAAVATHIFVVKQWEIGKVYWRVEQKYDSKTKGTSRTADENGVYTVPFYCDGETVEVKFKEKKLVDIVDHANSSNCYFGFEFDSEGYAVKILNSVKATHTVLQCERFDIVELNADGSYVAADTAGNSGKRVQGVVNKDCAIYDISPVASAEGEKNRTVDSIKLHDRVYIWTDTVGTPVLIYITSRRADSPAYYNPDPRYDSKAKQTTRTPNADGYYEVELLEAGKTELQTFYVKDLKQMNTIDSAADRCVGLKVGEGNVVEFVYSASSVFGNSNLCRGYTVYEASSAMVVVKSSSGKTTKNGLLSVDCKIWDVSGTGVLGAEATLQVGDVIYAMQAPSGEIVNIYITKRPQAEP